MSKWTMEYNTYLQQAEDIAYLRLDPDTRSYGSCVTDNLEEKECSGGRVEGGWAGGYAENNHLVLIWTLDQDPSAGGAQPLGISRAERVREAATTSPLREVATVRAQYS